MLTVWHLVKADVRRSRWLIAGWLLLVAAMTIFDGVRPAFDSRIETQLAFGLSRSLLWTATQLLGILLVALVVQTHPLVGSDAFWTTRPIGPGALLRSKIVLLAVLIVGAPVLAQAVLMIVYEVPPASIARAVLQMVLLRAVALVAIMSLATLTASLAQFFVLGAAVMIGLAVLSTILLTISLARPLEAHLEGVGGPRLPFLPPDPTTHVVRMGGAIAAFLALIAAQYRTRLRRTSVGAGATGLFIAFLAGSIWPWPMLRVRTQAPTWTASDATVQLRPDQPTAMFDPTPRDTDGQVPLRVARIPLWIDNLEPGWIPLVNLIDASLTLETGKVVASRGASYAVTVPTRSGRGALTTIVADVLGVGRVGTSHHSPNDGAPIALVVPPSDASTETLRSGTYDGRFRVSLFHCEPGGSLPLQTGGIYRDGPYRLTVDDISNERHGVVVHVRESRATTYFDRRPGPAFWFYLRNRRAGEAATGSVEGIDDMSRSMGFAGPYWIAFPVWYSLTLFPKPFDARGGTITFASAYFPFLDNEAIAQLARNPRERPPLKPVVELDDAWVAGAELVIVRATYEGSVVRALHIPGVRIETRREP